LFSGYISESLDYFKELLSYCVGKNASKLATELLSKYSTIENVFTASAGELESVCGEKCTFYIKLLAYITSRRRTESFSFGIRHTKVQIAEYLKAIFLGESIEKTYLISFDAEGRTVGINLLSEGTVNSSEILPRKAMEIAINSSARNVSLAHNHPFGTTKASIDDINISKHFSMLFATCEIGLLDHYIVAGQLCDTVNFEL
jgi:DNA repair protein RadC